MKIKPTNNSGEVVLQLTDRDEPLLKAASTAPFRLKKILVPIDFSDCSWKALQYAVPLAQQHNAAITLLYVVMYAMGEYTGIDYGLLETEMRANGEKQLTELVKDEVRGKVPANTAVRMGMPAVEIVEFAKSLPADIIVISTHGRTGLKHVLLGSVAEHVVQHATCPVLIVREQERECLAN